jgi:hypothetical protein
VVLVALDVGNEADAACVVLKFGIVQTVVFHCEKVFRFYRLGLY